MKPSRPLNMASHHSGYHRDPVAATSLKTVME